MLMSPIIMAAALASHARPHTLINVARAPLTHAMRTPPRRQGANVPNPAVDNANDCFFTLRELVRQRRVGAAVDELARHSTSSAPPPASVVVSVLRCAALAGDLRAERRAYKVWADTWRSAGLPLSEVQAVEQGRAVAVSAAGDVASAAYRLQRLAYSDCLPVCSATLTQICHQITRISKELAPSSSRRPRRALRRLGGVELVPGCLCCQPTAGGAKARIEAARTIAALAALASRSAGAAAATQPLPRCPCSWAIRGGFRY